MKMLRQQRNQRKRLLKMRLKWRRKKKTKTNQKQRRYVDEEMVVETMCECDH